MATTPKASHSDAHQHLIGSPEKSWEPICESILGVTFRQEDFAADNFFANGELICGGNYTRDQEFNAASQQDIRIASQARIEQDPDTLVYNDFLDQIWMLYDGRLDRSAMLRISDDDGDINNALHNTLYELIYVQIELLGDEPSYTSYYSQGRVELGEFGGYPSLELNGANVGIKDTTGNIAISHGADGVYVDTELPRLIVPTTSTYVNDRLSAKFNNPISSFDHDWAIQPVSSQLDLKSLFGFAPFITTDIVNLFREETASQHSLFDSSTESWSLIKAMDIALGNINPDQPSEKSELNENDYGLDPLALGYLESIFKSRETIPYYLNAHSRLETLTIELIDIIDSLIDLDFERVTSNEGSLLDIYVNNDASTSNWVIDPYDQYLMISISVDQGSSLQEAGYLINTILSHTFDVTNIADLSLEDTLELISRWKEEDDSAFQQLLPGESVRGEIDFNEVDRYSLTIYDSSEDSESYLFLDTINPDADLDISLIDIYGDEVAYAATMESQEYLDLTAIPPGEYSVEVYGYGNSTGAYDIYYMTASAEGNIVETEKPWNLEDLTIIGELNGKLYLEEGPIYSSKFYGFTIDGDTNQGRWQINIEDSPWDSDLDLYLYRASDSIADAILSSSKYGSNEAISLRGLERNDYILEVRNYTGNASDYSLVFRAPRGNASNPGDQYEIGENGNNSVDDAVNISINEEVMLNGLSIHNSQDTDYFSFELAIDGQDGSFISISLDSDSGDLDLYVYGPNDRELSSTTSDLFEFVSLAGLPAGVYTAAIVGYSGATGSYELNISHPAIESLSPDSYEGQAGNNDFASASDLGEISGLISINNLLNISANGADRDFYQFRLAGDGRWPNYISLNSNDSRADLDLKLYTIEGDLIESSTNWGSIESISIDGLDAGATYILEVWSHNEQEAEYSLFFNLPINSLRDDPYERNNVAERATTLPLASGKLYWEDLNLSTQDDIDWFEVSIPSGLETGSFIRVSSLDQSDSLAVQLKERDSDEILYFDSSLYASTELELAGLIEGDYLLRVSGEQSRYSLEVGLVEESDNNQIELDRFDSNGIGNDAFSSSTFLRLGSDVVSFENLSIHQHDDVDWFTFTLPKGGTLSTGLSITFDTREGDLDLDLYEVDNNALGDRINFSAGTSGEEFVSFEGLRGGTYAAKVFAYEGVSSDYTLTIELPNISIVPDQFETNNTVADAFQLRHLSGISRLNGSIHEADDVDFFRFSTLADTSLAHSVATSGLAGLSLTLFDSNQQEVRSGLGSLSLTKLTANSEYFLKIANSNGLDTGDYELTFQLPAQSTSVTTGEESTDSQSLDDWTLMVYLTASDLDQFAFNDINELEDAVSRFSVGANVAVYWDQSAAGSVNPFATGNNRQSAWSTAGKAFVQPDTNPSVIATNFIIEDTEVNTGDKDTLYGFIKWASTEAPAEHYGLIMWDHGAGVIGSNFDNADNIPSDFLINSELINALDLSKAEGIDFDLIAFDACLMAMTEIAYELKDHTSYYVASEEIENGAGYEYTTAFSVFETTASSVAPKELARSLVNSFENQYLAPGNIADTLSAIQTNQLEQLVSSLRTFTAAAIAAPVEQRRALSSLRDQSVSYESVFGGVYDPSYIDLGDWLSRVSTNASISQNLKNLAQLTLSSLQASVEYKTRDSRNSYGLAIYFPATSKSQDPIRDLRIDYEGQFNEFLTDTGWYSFISALQGLSQSSTGASSRSLNLSLDNESASKALNLGLLSGSNNVIPISSKGNLGKSFFAFQFEGNADEGSTVGLSGLKGAGLSIRSANGSKILAIGTETISLNALQAGRYIVEIDASNALTESAPLLVLNVPDAESTAIIPNNTIAKADDFGLFASDRLITGGLISEGQIAYYQFETPKFPSARLYGVTLLVGGSSIIKARILSADGKTTISEASGESRLELSYQASGNGEGYLLEVSSPTTTAQKSTALTTPRATSFALTVESDINISPSNIALTSSHFNENITAETIIAQLSTDDPDRGDTHIYSLVSGEGASDNDAFAIDGDNLKIKLSPNFESKSSYSIRLQTKDSGGLTLEKTVTLYVSNLNEVPSALNISSSSFDENITAGSTVATLSSTDPDGGDFFTYALIAGSGDSDNSAFSLDGNQLKIKASPDFENKPSYSIRVQTTDAGGLSIDKKFSLLVTDLPESQPVNSDLITSFSSGGSTIQSQLGRIDAITFAPTSFRGLVPDIIIDFESGLDKLILPKSVFKKLKKLDLTTLTKKKDIKKASQGLNKSQLVYNKLTGHLIYDENGKKKGLGNGGAFAQFQDDVLPTLSQSDFELG